MTDRSSAFATPPQDNLGTPSLWLPGHSQVSTGSTALFDFARSPRSSQACGSLIQGLPLGFNFGPYSRRLILTLGCLGRLCFGPACSPTVAIGHANSFSTGVEQLGRGSASSALPNDRLHLPHGSNSSTELHESVRSSVLKVARFPSEAPATVPLSPNLPWWENS